MTAPAEHPSINRFRTELERVEGRPVEPGRIVVLPDSVHTAQLAADALGCPVGAIANSLLFAAEAAPETAPGVDQAAGAPGSDHHDEPVLILTSGAHRVDTEKVAQAIGVRRLKRARPDFVREHTGQVIGGVSPIAHPRPVRTYVDPALAQYDVVWAAAGHPAAVFSSTYAELRSMTGAEEIVVN